MTVDIISYPGNQSPQKYGTGLRSNSRPLDLLSDSHLLPDLLPTALRGPVLSTECLESESIQQPLYLNRSTLPLIHCAPPSILLCKIGIVIVSSQINA